LCDYAYSYVYFCILFVFHDFYILLFHHLFFFNDTATTEIYTLSLHDALPILLVAGEHDCDAERRDRRPGGLRHIFRIAGRSAAQDRKSTRLNSSHVKISYAVFCLKKKKNKKTQTIQTHQDRNISHLPHATLDI